MQISGKTKLLGIIGQPVEHSLSPLMHNAAIARLGLDYVYVPWPVTGERLGEVVAALEGMGVVGFNVTIPHKQVVMPFLAEIAPLAQLIGAVNTVSRSPLGWRGTNTDIAGFLAPLQALKRDWRKTEPLILGNGGAARAVVVGCAQLGCRQIHVFGRSGEKLQQFQASWQSFALITAIQVHSWSELPEFLPQAQLLVNTTPVGMASHPGTPIAAADLGPLPRDCVVYDLIYTPRPTEFLRLAAEQGALTIDGLEMLVQQGAAALEIWLDCPAPVEVMRQALLEYFSA